MGKCKYNFENNNHSRTLPFGRAGGVDGPGEEDGEEERRGGIFPYLACSVTRTSHRRMCMKRNTFFSVGIADCSQFLLLEFCERSLGKNLRRTQRMVWIFAKEVLLPADFTQVACLAGRAWAGRHCGEREARQVNTGEGGGHYWEPRAYFGGVEISCIAFGPLADRHFTALCDFHSYC